MQMQDYRIYLQTPQDNNQNDLVKTEQMTGNTWYQTHTYTYAYTHTQHAHTHRYKHTTQGQGECELDWILHFVHFNVPNEDFLMENSSRFS